MAQSLGAPLLTTYEAPRQPISIFQQRLPINDGQLHFLVPAGVGDNLWIMSKFWSVCEQRQTTFWLADKEQRRSGDIFRMMGLRYGYMPDLSTDWVWSRPGMPPIPDTGAILSIQPNRHLEHGHRLEKWYPDLPIKNPVSLFKEELPPLFKQESGATKYVVAFMCHQQYMEDGGNLLPGVWARILRQIEKDVGPVVLIGAGKDCEFIRKVCQFFAPSLDPFLDQPLDIIASVMQGSQMCIGAHAGPLILSTFMQIPTVHFYPRWLHPMPGSWEMEDAIWHAVFLDEAELFVNQGIKFEGNKCIGRLRAEAQPIIKVYGESDCLTTEGRSNGVSSADITMPDMVSV